tara:strand:+ start:274 stop:705 length:432 start_codon:yes stop_codon:yes gene_type:complete
MAYFAELDNNNIVLRVIVVGNDIAANGGTLGDNDMHVDGETWCSNLLGGIWKQTSYNSNFRKQYAGTGMLYDETKNKFILPKPYNSWTLDVNDDWQAPVTYPTDITDKIIIWEEVGQKWMAKDFEDPANHFNWDSSTLAWVSA